MHGGVIFVVGIASRFTTHLTLTKQESFNDTVARPGEAFSCHLEFPMSFIRLLMVDFKLEFVSGNIFGNIIGWTDQCVQLQPCMPILFVVTVRRVVIGS